MSSLISAFLRRGNPNEIYHSVAGLSAFVDHIIRLFTVFGFLTGLINLRNIHPDNAVIAVLLVVLGFSIFFYTAFLIDYIVVGICSITPYFKNNEYARQIAVTIIAIVYIYFSVEYYQVVGAYLAELKLFG
ncbi:hypothetical protein ACTOV4_00555 [Brucella sp. C7-11G]